MAWSPSASNEGTSAEFDKDGASNLPEIRQKSKMMSRSMIRLDYDFLHPEGQGHGLNRHTAINVVSILNPMRRNQP
jgi:hypothetical protein